MTSTIELPASRATESDNGSAPREEKPARINVPLDLTAWKELPEPLQTDLAWFHQYALNQRMDWDDVAAALGYDRSTVFRVLKGTYEGSWDNIAAAIRSYKKLEAKRGASHAQEFAETPWTRRVFGALDYALVSNSITVIIGESRQGKSISAQEWARLNNHGRSVYVVAPAYGGARALLTAIAEAVGVGVNNNALKIHAAVIKSFNRNRILIVDEAHRLLPGPNARNATELEVLRDIHDKTGCALALIATARFDLELKQSKYMFEQLIGRIEMPARLPKLARAAEVLPIVEQFIPRPTEGLMLACIDIANQPGRLGVLVGLLKAASRIAAKKSAKLAEVHVYAAMKLREQMGGA
jgi:DNA transposition AAA+ family ATPase